MKILRLHSFGASGYFFVGAGVYLFFLISFTVLPTTVTVHLIKNVSEHLKTINNLPSSISIEIFSKILLASRGTLG